MNYKKKTKVLELVAQSRSKSFGGVESFLFHFYQHMKRQELVCDFAFCGENLMQSVMDDPIFSDSVFYELNVLKGAHNGIIDYYRLFTQLKKLIISNKYDAVHINTNFYPVNVACLLAAKSAHCKVRISHSHGSKSIATFRLKPRDKVRRLIQSILTPIYRCVIRANATHYFACSTEAGEYLFGKTGLKSPKYKKINNAIEAKEFIYDKEKRDIIRRTYHIQDQHILIGNIGRLFPFKNQTFLIDVFKKIHDNNKNARLWIVGGGYLHDDLEERIKSLGLSGDAALLGECSNVPDLMQAMDLVIFPSPSEGLSIVTIETQASGLPIYVSDTISREHKVTDLIEFLPLQKGAGFWADYIMKDYENKQRKNTFEEIKNCGYDIEDAALKLEQFYIEVSSNE